MPKTDTSKFDPQAFKQLREAFNSPSSDQQRQKIVAILKANPEMAAFINQQFDQKQRQKQLLQPQHQQTSLNEGNMTRNQTMRPREALPNPKLSLTAIPTQAPKQLLETSKSPPSVEQPQEVQIILKPNPLLNESFINQSTTQQQQQQMLLNEGNSTMRPREVLSNPDLSMQNPTQSWKQLIKTLKFSSVKEQQNALAILKANSPLMANFINQRRAQQEKQQQKKLLQQQHMLLMESNMMGNPTVRSQQVSPDPELSIAGLQRPTPAWNQLLEFLKSPLSAREQQKAITILKANPHLIGAFIKHRTALKEQQRQMLLNAGAPNIETDHEKPFLNWSNRDVDIEVRRSKFNCHNCILGVRSPIFTTMEHDITRNSGTVTIEDSEQTTFRWYLFYLYTGSKSHLSWKNVIDRYKLANKYCVGDMEKLCAVYIKKNITTENFYDFFLLSHMHNDREIIDITIQFFLKNSKEIIENKKWAVFVTENPVESTELIRALHCK